MKENKVHVFTKWLFQTSFPRYAIGLPNSPAPNTCTSKNVSKLVNMQKLKWHASLYFSSLLFVLLLKHYNCSHFHVLSGWRVKTKQNNSNFTCTNICSYNSSSYLLQSSSIPEPGYVWQLNNRAFVLISAVTCVCVCVCVCCSSRCLLTPDSVCFSSSQKWHLILRSCLYRVTECIKCN